MKFTITEGDLIKMFRDGKFDLIAHGANCFHTFGSGIARTIREEFPDAFKADVKCTKYGDYNKLGSYSQARVHTKEYESGLILNCYTQFNYGRDKRHLDYEALAMCLKKINKEFPEKRIGLPLIGCGQAGGDWSIVEPMIREHLKDMTVTIVKYKEK